jgi:phosphoribosyl-AMP cyclohydrolase
VEGHPDYFKVYGKHALYPTLTLLVASPWGWHGRMSRVIPISAQSSLPAEVAARLKRDRDGLVCAVVQQHDSGQVLMVGWMDDEALHRTMTSGRVTFWSRSRGEYWRKGDTSGHAQYVKSVALDCDGDALLVRVDQIGAACHTGARSCFDDHDLGAMQGSRDE